MVIIKTKKEIEVMRAGGKILAGILAQLKAAVKPGVSTAELEDLACDLINKAGGRPAFKGYKSYSEAPVFPTALCLSINNEVVHAPALPARQLAVGDLLSIDIGMQYPANGGLYTDMAVTVGVGAVSSEAQRLMAVTEKALQLGIAAVAPQRTLNDIGRAIQTYVEREGFSVVRDLVGHGVGRKVHEDPQVPNFVMKEKHFKNLALKPGMTIAIEPMVNVGDWQIVQLADGFTIATRDGALSAHFEHTIAVTEDGAEVMTQ